MIGHERKYLFHSYELNINITINVSFQIRLWFARMSTLIRIAASALNSLYLQG